MLLSQALPPQDSLFLLAESREQPMHVGSLELFQPPSEAGPDYVAELYRRVVSEGTVQRRFRKRPTRGVASLGQWAWTYDDDVDLEHHVRHSALPRPGRVRELLALVSRLHGTLLDRQRPLWEVHLIEGLADGRFAVYTKIHHSLLDGVAGMRLVSESLTEDPARRDMPLPFVEDPADGVSAPRSRRGGPGLGGLARGGLDLATAGLGLAPRLLRIADTAMREQSVALPMSAPRTILNGPITGSRRIAADDWPLERMRAVADAASSTLNDVVLAMCGGALRGYLVGLDALPAESLVAMAPVSLRREAGGEARGEADADAGNAVGAVLVLLGTHLDDARQRLAFVSESARHAKGTLRGLNQVQATALSTMTLAPQLLPTAFNDASRVVPPAYNVVVSNVPGPRRPMFWNGAELVGLYPLSIPTSGQALNITVASYAGRMGFGLVGCRRTLPHLQQLLAGLGEELAELERALGTGRRRRR